MKFLVITAVQAFEQNIKALLKKSEVHSYSHTEVTGHGGHLHESLESNWFASDLPETASLLFYVFVNKENVDKIFEEVHAFNNKQESKSRIHVAMLNIEKTNEP